jgi:hypothetical protein
MNAHPFLLSLLTAGALAAATAGPAAEPAPVDAPLACRLDALSATQRERHRKLSELLARAVSEARELPDGYELTLDLSRLPRDTQGDPVCVVEVAEWVDLEARCCPFLDFAIRVRGAGGHNVSLALTGGASVKAFLKTEFPLLEKKLESGS